jgi:hypothetical protein
MMGLKVDEGDWLMRYRILRGTDWRGDATFSIYDNMNRISIGPRFYAEVHAEDYISSLKQV